MTTITRENLLSLLQHAMLAVDSKPTMPILTNVLIEIDDKMTITGSNLDIQARASCPINHTDSIRAAVSGKLLTKIIKSLPKKSSVALAINGNTLKLSTDNGEFLLPVADHDQLPIISPPTRYEYAADPAKLYNLLDKSIHAQAKTDCRSYLNGYRISIDDGILTGIATDGHRLAIGRIPVIGDSVAATLVHEGATALLKMLKNRTDNPVEMDFGSEHIHIRHGSYTLTVKLIDGKYPDCDRVIPKTRTHAITVNKNDLLVAITKVTLLNTEKLKAVLFSFSNNNMTITGYHDEIEETANILATYSGDPFEVKFNAGYWTDFLKVIEDETITLKMENCSTDSCLVESDGLQFVLMPVRM